MSRFLILIACTFLLPGSERCLHAGDADQGFIAVEVKGRLANVTFVTGPDDDSQRLATASVRAAGQELPLDYTRCVAARRELIRRFATPGSSSVAYPEVVVKGRLEFRAPTEGGDGKVPTVPVVVVESLEIGGLAFIK